jgi:bacteriorhodopsin
MANVSLSVSEITLWAVFGVMLFSSAIFGVLMVRQPRQRRLYHYITLFITLTSTLAYFALANGLGIAKVEVPPADGESEPTYRYFYYARYIDWIITTPLVLLDLGLLSGLDLVTIVLLVVADVYMVSSALVGTLSTTSNLAKWGYFSVDCLIYLYISYTLLTLGAISSKTHSPRVHRLYLSLSIFILVLWLFYPLIWAFSYGTNSLTEGSEVFAYAALDVLGKAVFGFWILLAHDQLLPIPRSHTDEERQRLNPSGGYGATRH